MLSYKNKPFRFSKGVHPIIPKVKRNERGGIVIRQKFVYGLYTDKGNKKEVNEDSVLIQHIQMKQGELMLACICDGIGGLKSGEIASGYICEELRTWFYEQVVYCVCKYRFLRKNRIKKSGFRIFEKINQELVAYGKEKELLLGSTVTLMLFYKKKYYLFHIGDSSAMIFTRTIKKITKEHALNHYIITKCIGVTKEYKPDFKYGQIKKKEGILLCSDGFLRKVKVEEMVLSVVRKEVNTQEKIEKWLQEIAKRSIGRGEKDNISAIFLKRIG